MAGLLLCLGDRRSPTPFSCFAFEGTEGALSGMLASTLSQSASGSVVPPLTVANILFRKNYFRSLSLLVSRSGSRDDFCPGSFVSVLDDLQIQWIKYARSLEGAHVPLPVRCRRERDTNLSATGAGDYDPMIPKDYPLFGTVVGNAHYQRDGAASKFIKRT
jgi:hypothetical protein